MCSVCFTFFPSVLDMCYPIPNIQLCAITCQLSFVIFVYSALCDIILCMSKYTGQTPARRKASEKYRTEKIDTILVRVPKGQKEIIQNAASKKDVSLNQFIVDAINDALNKDM